MDWKAVAEKIIQDDQNKWDRTVPARELRVGESGAIRLSGANGESFPLSEIAVNQLCGKLEIPAKCYRRLPGEMQALSPTTISAGRTGNLFSCAEKASGYERFF